jgi:exodeoxyribonuclease VII large subunit
LKERMVLALRKKLELYGKELLQLQTSMRRVMESKLDSVALELRGMFGKLEALSPLKVLERGYSIAYKLPFMTVIKDSKEIKSGDKVLIRFHGGRAVCVVEEVEN